MVCDAEQQIRPTMQRTAAHPRRWLSSTSMPSRMTFTRSLPARVTSTRTRSDERKSRVRRGGLPAHRTTSWPSGAVRAVAGSHPGYSVTGPLTLPSSRRGGAPPGVATHILHLGAKHQRPLWKRGVQDAVAARAAVLAAVPAGSLRPPANGVLRPVPRPAAVWGILAHPYWVFKNTYILGLFFKRRRFDAGHVSAATASRRQKPTRCRQHAGRRKAPGGNRCRFVGVSDAHGRRAAGKLFGWYYSAWSSRRPSGSRTLPAIRGLHSVAVEVMPGTPAKVYGPVPACQAHALPAPRSELALDEGKLMLALIAGEPRAEERLGQLRGQAAALYARSGEGRLVASARRVTRPAGSPGPFGPRGLTLCCKAGGALWLTSHRGKRDSRGEWQPDPLPSPSPHLQRLPWKPVDILKYLFGRGFLGRTTSCTRSWRWQAGYGSRRSLDGTATFQVGWIAEVYARNAVLLYPNLCGFTSGST